MPWIKFLAVIISLQATMSSGQTASTEKGSGLMHSNHVQILQGRDGAAGRDGRDGIVGPQGHAGFPGFPGHKGETGDHGKTGPNGMKGELGDAGPRGLSGPSGIQGPKGQIGHPGTPSTPTGGVTYTRWGASSCRTGATTLYGGRAGGSYYSHKGGASNYLCMPNDPQLFLPYSSGAQGNSEVYGVEYEAPVVSNRNHHNALCAVCYISNKMTVVMTPAKLNCPSGWTREYFGYLMSQYKLNYRTEYVCVDRVMESVPGSQINTNGGGFWHVEANCNGMACPPYNNYKELTCVVCTK